MGLQQRLTRLCEATELLRVLLCRFYFSADQTKVKVSPQVGNPLLRLTVSLCSLVSRVLDGRAERSNQLCYYSVIGASRNFSPKRSTCPALVLNKSPDNKVCPSKPGC